ncbi:MULTISPECIES: bifunctional methylenetetrahydrofolate dehydrogenase/methenyltetrahydrofolate cyclohydrolase [Enterococcus]|uniref:Bifunctional protein FolD n=1 Tax=Enterococcus sulfureus ATCC 49903 TaxID=1140003 RepID=S0LG86_9ENTE|nr:bifunctional methylenetetrahydrofolate dehydrogenase/methenyltetrahydrofolate cyclohydrolase [Enterococcus sulfureus]EOT51383.1 FolD protein [Enterococcus sulfureus ATCC 49903]EOT87040.1 FolD protein [Enterococcus sulfureus ATCC 49903]
MPTIIDGKGLAQTMQERLKETIAKETTMKTPGLVVLLVGEDPASQTYVKNKELAATRIGIHSKIERLSHTITQEELLERIAFYNRHEDFHGILVQLPLPKHIDEAKIVEAIDPKKDVDGFHPMNLGHLFAGTPEMIPCTPYGIMEMFNAYEIDLTGKHAVVIGRSNIVGKPMAQLLLAQNATVTMAHSKTKELAALAKTADILVVAIGRGHFVTQEFIKEGAVVIDVGMNRDDKGKLIGDVKFDEVAPLTSFITPVPKGVGPMTITMLMQQTYEAAKRQERSKLENKLS